MTTEKAQNLVQVEVRKIIRDKSLQVRNRTNLSHVYRLVAAYKSGREIADIQIAVIEGRPYLIDGWHRVAALRILSRDGPDPGMWRSTYAEVVPAADIEEARWLAAQANLSHGLPLKQSELRNVFRAFVRARRHHRRRGTRFRGEGAAFLSYREMGREIGVSHNTVRNWMMKDYPKIAAKIGGTDEFKGKGGLPERMPPAERAALRSLEATHEAFKRETDETIRGRLIKAVEGTLVDMKTAADWIADDFADHDDF